MPLIQLIKGASYTYQGVTVKHGDVVEAPQEIADYLVSGGYFEDYDPAAIRRRQEAAERRARGPERRATASEVSSGIRVLSPDQLGGEPAQTRQEKVTAAKGAGPRAGSQIMNKGAAAGGVTVVRNPAPEAAEGPAVPV